MKLLGEVVQWSRQTEAAWTKLVTIQQALGILSEKDLVMGWVQEDGEGERHATDDPRSFE